MFSAAPQETLSPWHEGELQLQRRAGVVEKMDDLGRRYIRNHLTEQHREFYPQLPFVVLGAVDTKGDVWATLRAGPPGFLGAPDETHLHVAAPRDASDPAEAGMEDGDAIALLGIQLSTRRRNRMNGRVQRAGEGAFTLAVRQAYGNCPQYIQCRDFTFIDSAEAAPAIIPVINDRFDEISRAIVRNADTFFVASYVEGKNGQRSVDVSHRGGNPGFIRLDADGGLTIPDFSGNLFFNTFGNFSVNPKAGLAFVGFDNGDLLQMTGDVEMIFDGPELAAFEGAERLWRFRPRRIIRRPQALPLRWSFMADGWSPKTLATGSWVEAARRMGPAAEANTWRAFRIAQVVDESSVVRSFILEPADGGPAATHQAGQYLPVRTTLPGDAEPVQRNYTLSVAPSDARYRISVKRDGRFSSHLHSLRAGDVIEARAPAGNFLIDPAERRPVVLLAGGIGVTPMLAMLRHLEHEGKRTGRIRPTWFFHAARNAAERAFDAELSELVAAAHGAVRRIRLLTDATAAGPEAYDHIGLIDMDMLRASLPFDDYDFYLCGPVPFMQALYDGLRGLNIADARIHAEAFGPASSLRRRPDLGGEAGPAPVPATQPVSVAFVRSGKEVVWAPASGSLLDFAEVNGLSPEFSCRNGSCGTCRTRIIDGEAAYATSPTAQIAQDECLICCAMPAARNDGGENRLVLDL
jgi:uncharacterized protein